MIISTSFGESSRVTVEYPRATHFLKNGECDGVERGVAAHVGKFESSDQVHIIVRLNESGNGGCLIDCDGDRAVAGLDQACQSLFSPGNGVLQIVPLQDFPALDGELRLTVDDEVFLTVRNMTAGGNL